MADKRDTNSNEPSRDGYVRGLKRELAGYVANGNAERAEQVRAELARIGAGEEPSRPKREPVERAVAEPAEKAEPVRKRASRPKPAKGA